MCVRSSPPTVTIRHVVRISRDNKYYRIVTTTVAENALEVSGQTTPLVTQDPYFFIHTGWCDPLAEIPIEEARWAITTSLKQDIHIMRTRGCQQMRLFIRGIFAVEKKL
jgi:hypothetical protein